MFDFADSFWNVASPGFSDWFLSLSRDVNKLRVEVKTWMVSFCDRIVCLFLFLSLCDEVHRFAIFPRVELSRVDIKFWTKMPKKDQKSKNQKSIM